MQEHLSSGISKDDFVNRLRKLLGAPPIAGSASSTPTNQPTSPPATSQAHSSAERAPPSSAPTVTPSPASISPPTSKTKGKQKATEPTQEPQPATATATAAQDDARYALRKKKLEEKEELARIKSRIEADKAERKAQAEARKAAREQQKLQSSPTTSTPTPNFQAPSTRGSRSTTVHLNIRLFSGLTIRSAFPRTATLETDVRPWIDREAASRADLEIPRDTLPPYIFKQILAPLPSRELTAGDESQALGDIELAPSATLVLVPVKGYKEAYADGAGGIVSGATGVATAIVGGVLGLAGSALGFVGSTIGAVVGGGGEVTGSEQRPGGQQAGRALGDAQQEQEQEQGVRVRTLADQRAREPRSQQLYNGNQVCSSPSLFYA